MRKLKPGAVQFLAQKEFSQATIMRKLSSYIRQNRTRKALNRGRPTIGRAAPSRSSRRETSRAHRGRSAVVERMLASYRERDHLLQHRASVPGVRAKTQPTMDLITGMSPVAWQHVGSVGRICREFSRRRHCRSGGEIWVSGLEPEFARFLTQLWSRSCPR